MLLFDTDVLIDHLRGQPAARAFIKGTTEQKGISATTVAELYAGVREGNEHAVLEAFLRRFVVVPISAEIAERGGLLRRDYRKSHNTGFIDALIAATAETEGATLVTLNEKHFPMLDVVVPYQKK